MSVPAPALVARDLYRFYHAGDDETLALRGVSLAVDAGETVAVVGPSGSGKSTLLACLAGIDEPDGGMVQIAGTPMSRRPEAERAKLRAGQVGVLFQTGNLVEHLSVRDNLIVGQRLAGRVDASRVDELLDRLAMTERSTARPSQLSGGETARAGLGVALVNEPAVLLADEPTGELDSATAARVVDLLHDASTRGTAVLIVTHNSQVSDIADRVVELRDGEVVR